METLPISTEELGLPEKFDDWRPCQITGINRALNPQARVQVHAMPTGSGKSLSYVGTSLITEDRSLYLTATKGLQDQIAADFRSVGIADLRGRQNYRCRMGKNMTCEDGKHAGCYDAKTTACPHRCAVETAKKSRRVVTNYHCWMSHNLFGEKDALGSFDALVLDELHSVPEIICGIIGVEFTVEDVYKYIGTEFPENADDIKEWRSWAAHHLSASNAKREALGTYIRDSGDSKMATIRELSKWNGICRRLELVAGMRGPWVVETSAHGYRLDPLWPSQYAEHALLSGIPRVYGYSATVSPKTVHMLGINPDDLQYFQYPSTFPAKRSPVYRIPTCRVDRHMTPSDKGFWISRMDQILARRGDRKGIIHCVSYQRREEIMRESEYSRWMVGHTPDETAEVMEWFRACKPPMYLVSPSVTTGYDFPGSDCEVQIIAKLPFPDSRSRVMQARSKADPLYIPYLTAQTLVQATGRGMRYRADQCENFIVDDHIARMMAAHRDQFLDWWLKLYHRRDLIPDPPPVLNGAGGY